MTKHEQLAELYQSTARPFWANFPVCLSCGWDDDAGGQASVFAAYRASQPGRWHEEQSPYGDTYVDFHDFVAFLCEECADREETVQWFGETVKGRYPDAVFVREPGRAGEEVIDTAEAPASRLAEIYHARKRRTRW